MNFLYAHLNLLPLKFKVVADKLPDICYLVPIKNESFIRRMMVKRLSEK